MNKKYLELEIEMLSRLLDNFEYFKSGLCILNHAIFLHAEHLNSKFFVLTRKYLDDNLPKPKFKAFLSQENSPFSWPPGDADRRFYWLKYKISEARAKLNSLNSKQ